MTCKLFRTRPVETKCIVVFEIKQYSLSSSSFINTYFFIFFLIMSDTIIIHSNGASFKHERAFGRCSFHPKIVVELFLFANLEHIEVFFILIFSFLNTNRRSVCMYLGHSYFQIPFIISKIQKGMKFSIDSNHV